MEKWENYEKTIHTQKRKWNNPKANKKIFKCRVKENYSDTTFYISDWQELKSNHRVSGNAMGKQ